jgi:enamine deaminase RidA (YjgF/YER057c/UK114 family)
MRAALVVVCLLGAGTISEKWNAGQTKEASKMDKERGSVRFVKSDTLPPSPGYSQAVDIRSGARIIYVAGQVAMDRSGKLVGEGDFRAQVTQTFENLKAALQASGASFNNVVKLNSYFVDTTQLPVFREVRDKYINTSAPPASTAVKVAGLFREGFLVEVEAVAAVPE